MSTSYAKYTGFGGGSAPASGNLTDVGTDGIVITGGTGAVLGAGTQIAQHVADTTHNGYLSSTDWNTFNAKQAALTIGNLTDAGTDGIVVTGGTGAIIGSGVTLAQHVADTTHNGYLSSTDWNTFNNKQSTLTLGNLTDAGTDGIVITSGTGAVVGSGTSIAQHVADTTHNGYLSSTDWNTFNSKQAALSITNLTDVGTDGITITNGTGAVIGASPVTISQRVADTTHNGYLNSTDWNTFNGKQAAGNYITALTGDVTASGPGSVAATLAATSNATLTTISSLVSVGTITTGTWSATTIALNKGGTGQTTKAPAFDALSPMSAGGDLIYGGASGTGTRLPNGTAGQALLSAGTTLAPVWTTLTAPTKQILASGTGATYTTPAGCKLLKVTVIGPGGGGGGSQGTAANSAAGGGGGGGGVAIKWIASPSGSYLYTLASTGGAAGTTGNNAGQSGTNTTFDNSGSTITGSSGGGGNGGASTTAIALETGQAGGGAATGGDLNIPGGAGGAGMVWALTNSLGGYGGSSMMGMSTAGAIGGDGSAGQNYGGGGSGGGTTNSATGHAGGIGSKGAIIVEEFYQ